MISKCTIYLLKNIINNKVYIGQTWLPLNARMGKNGINYKNSTKLYNAIKKYGIINFKYQILEECTSQEEADKLEYNYIKLYNSCNTKIGYNLKLGGSFGKHSEISKNKISKSIKNKIWSKQALKAKSDAGKLWKGKLRGIHTKEHNSKISQSMIEWHNKHNHPMQDRYHSQESKQKISLSLKGRKHSLEHINKRVKKIKMPLNKENSIINNYNQGLTINQIRILCKTGISSIYRVLKRNNIQIRKNIEIM